MLTYIRYVDVNLRLRLWTDLFTVGQDNSGKSALILVKLPNLKVIRLK